MNKLYDYGFYFIPTQNKQPIFVQGKMLGATSKTRDKEKVGSWMGWVEDDGFGISVVGGQVEGSDKYLVVLDVDIKKENGLSTLDDLEYEYGDLPKTLTVNTPSGGKHFYFLASEEIGSSVDSFAGKFEKPSGIDIKGRNGYVQAPPTQGYTFETDIPPAELPPSWTMLLKGLVRCERIRKEPFSIPPKITVEYNKKNDIREILIKNGYIPEGDPKKTRFFTHPFDATTKRNVVLLENKNFIPNGSEYISYHFGASDKIKAGPHDPWDITKILHYESNHDLMVNFFKSEIRSLSWKTLIPAGEVRSELGLELTERHWRVGDVFTVTGASSRKKTFFIIDAAFSGACELPFLNHFMVRTPAWQSVLYLSESQGDFGDRRTAWIKMRSQQHGIPEAELLERINANVWFSSQPIPLLGEDALENYESIKPKGVKFQPSLIFLDHYSFHFSGNNCTEENNNAQAASFVTALKKLAERENCAVGMIHHPPKNNGESGSTYRGASALFNNIPVSYDLKKPKNNDAWVVVEQMKCSYYNGHKSYLVRPEIQDLYIDKGSVDLRMRTGLTLDYVEEYVAEAEEKKVGAPKKLEVPDLVDAISDNKCDFKDLEKIFKDVHPKTLRTRLAEAVEAGMLIRCGSHKNYTWMNSPEIERY